MQKFERKSANLWKFWNFKHLKNKYFHKSTLKMKIDSKVEKETKFMNKNHYKSQK